MWIGTLWWRGQEKCDKKRQVKRCLSSLEFISTFFFFCFAYRLSKCIKWNMKKWSVLFLFFWYDFFFVWFIHLQHLGFMIHFDTMRFSSSSCFSFTFYCICCFVIFMLFWSVYVEVLNLIRFFVQLKPKWLSWHAIFPLF